MKSIGRVYEWNIHKSDCYIHKILSELPHMIISCAVTRTQTLKVVTTRKIKICWFSHRTFRSRRA